MALEQLWQTGPAAAASQAASPYKQNPLYTYLQGVAGFNAPSLAGLDQSPASGIGAPALNFAETAPPSVDYGALSSFYSDPSNTDYRSDPVLSQIKAADSTSAKNADSTALDARRKLLIQLGSGDVAKGVLDPSDPTLGAISEDPNTSTSALARLNRSGAATLKQNEEQYNKANLFYSSTRGEGLQNLQRDEDTARADAIANAQAALGSIDAQLAGAKAGYASKDAQAEADAYSRFLAAVAAHPPGAAGGAAGSHGAGTPITGEPTGYGGGGNSPYGGYTAQPGDTIDAAGDTAPPNIGEYPWLAAHPGDPGYGLTAGAVPDEPFQPVSVGANTSFEPKLGANAGAAAFGGFSTPTAPKKKANAGSNWDALLGNLARL